MDFSDHPEGQFAVICPECGARGSSDPSAAGAVYKWNRRGVLPIPDPGHDTQH